MKIKKESKHKYQDDILKICKKRHLTSEDILDKLKEKFPKIGQATIYRTIKNLSDRGLLNKISLNNKSFYETQEQFHGHLINKKKEISDFKISEKFLKEIKKKVGKDIKALDLKVFI